MKGWVTGGALALGLMACTPTEDSEPPDTAEETAAPGPAGDDQPALKVFAGTAWRVVAQDGARYTTLLDPDGAYRDLRNGDPWQKGGWQFDSADRGGLLCFTTDSEEAVRRCWKPGKMRGDTMIATAEDGRRIELTKVEYRPPETVSEPSG